MNPASTHRRAPTGQEGSTDVPLQQPSGGLRRLLGAIASVRLSAGAAYSMLGILGFFTVWQIVTMIPGLTNPRFLPGPGPVLSALLDVLSSPRSREDVQATATAYAIGYLWAAFGGVALGLVVGLTRIGRLLLWPYVWFGFSLPRVALAPLIVIWLGLGQSSKVTLVILMAIFPIIINTSEGVRLAPESLTRCSAVFGASRLQTMRKVILPSSIPMVAMGLRIGIVRGYVGIILGELLGSTRGLGVILKRATYEFDMPRALAIIVILVTMANLSLLIFDMITRPLHRQFPSLRSSL